ncbi:MAG: hypothetical protein KDD41_12745 [Flavobacteriales bacterium]|nr:hypothetical protein [Flavobacteriales bacterium]
MEHTFNRNPLPGILFLISAVLFSVTTFLQFAIGNPVAVLTLIASILFFINAFWSFSTPFMIIGKQTIVIKETLVRKKMIMISSIEKVTITNNTVIFTIQGNKTIKVNILLAMTGKDKAALQEALKDFTN